MENIKIGDKVKYDIETPYTVIGFTEGGKTIISISNVFMENIKIVHPKELIPIKTERNDDE